MFFVFLPIAVVFEGVAYAHVTRGRVIRSYATASKVGLYKNKEEERSADVLQTPLSVHDLTMAPFHSICTGCGFKPGPL